MQNHLEEELGQENDIKRQSIWGIKSFFKHKVRNLILAGLLIALTVVFTRFLAVQMLTVRISMEFLPIALTSVLFGPVVGAVCAALADFLGMLVFPSGGPYFPGFTFSTAVYAFIFGLFLYKRPLKPVNIMVCVLVNVFVVDFILIGLWLHILWQLPYEALVVTRAIKCAILYPVEVITVYYGFNAVMKNVRVMFDE